MDTGFESTYVQFHNYANDHFHTAATNFREAVKNIDREKEEYRFQQLKFEYVRSLEQNLEMFATSLLDVVDKRAGSAEASQTLKQFVKDYLHRFVQSISHF